jgi:hypothetical protein
MFQSAPAQATTSRQRQIEKRPTSHIPHAKNRECSQHPSPCLLLPNFLSSSAMKMWIGIGAEQDGEHSLRQHCSVNPPLSWTPRGPVISGTPTTKTPADQSLRRGTACCARCSVAEECHSSAITRSISAVASWLRPEPQPTSPQTSPAPEKRVETARHSGISTRFWPKSRNYRKQTIKPCLPGSRIAQCDSRELPSSIGQPIRRNR